MIGKTTDQKKPMLEPTFAETISRSTNSLVENSNLIQKVVFPSELLPVK